jgi:hypothetical protein
MIHCSFIIRARRHSSWSGYAHAQPPAVWRWRSVIRILTRSGLGTFAASCACALRVSSPGTVYEGRHDVGQQPRIGVCGDGTHGVGAVVIAKDRSEVLGGSVFGATASPSNSTCNRSKQKKPGRSTFMTSG